MSPKKINNEFYDTLHEKWVEAEDHPIALLRAENRTRNPWIHKNIPANSSILDIGCGGGFLTNYLAQNGHSVHGIDLSAQSLEVAKKTDSTNSVTYLQANATSLPFADNSFDVVSAMDILEHIENPESLISEASRVLKPNGLFFFHTFNRNFFSYLLAIKGIGWFVKNSPPDLHVYPLFIKPKELQDLLTKHNLTIHTQLGLKPDIFTFSFWKMIFTRTVSEKFSFTFTPSLTTGYLGYAKKGEIDGRNKT